MDTGADVSVLTGTGVSVAGVAAGGAGATGNLGGGAGVLSQSSKVLPAVTPLLVAHPQQSVSLGQALQAEHYV